MRKYKTNKPIYDIDGESLYKDKNEKIVVTTDWSKSFGVDVLDYVNYLCLMQDNSFVACADNSIYHISVSESANKGTLSFKLSNSFQCHDKIVKFCYTDSNRIATCSREPIIKIFDITKNDSNYFSSLKYMKCQLAQSVTEIIQF